MKLDSQAKNRILKEVAELFRLQSEREAVRKQQQKKDPYELS